MRVSLIITTYNRADALLLVLQSIESQSSLPAEVIIADDGSNNKTKELISSFQARAKINIIHSWQEDKGFRAAKSRNKAIAKSIGDYIILIDGDMILHPNFIHDHMINAQPNYFVQGSRVLLTKDKTNHVLHNKILVFSIFSWGLNNRKNAIHSNLLSKVFSTKKKFFQGIRSCNMAFYRDDCISVNGFNNEFEGWGREDSEFITRLVNQGIRRKTLRFNALQYHLWHPMSSKEPLLKNNQLLKSTVKNNLNYCENGINSFLEEV